MKQQIKYKRTWLQKLLFDIGRVVLMPLIAWYRAKKKYVGADAGKKKIKELKGAIIAANHSSFADPLILNSCFWYRRFFYTAGEAILTGVRGKLLDAAGCIKIDRVTTDVQSINKCADILKQDYLLGMFPQGTIAGGEAKGGMLLIAAMADSPIVPTLIVRRKHFWQRHVVIFGEPFKVSDYTKKALPGKKEIEILLNVFDERWQKCQSLSEADK